MLNDTYSKLIELLDKNKAEYRLIDHEPEGKTELVSPMRGNKLSDAANCIIVMVKTKKGTRHVLCVIPGDAKVNLDKVKEAFDGTGATLADKESAEKAAGSVLGTILPFSFNPKLELVVDPSVLKIKEMFFNAARLDRSVALKTSDYERIAKPRLESIAQYSVDASAKATGMGEDLYNLRHSLAHVLAQAVLKLWPGTQYAIGPPIDTGCYYDFLFKEPITDEDLKKIQKEMKKIISASQTFEIDSMSADDAVKYWKKNKQSFKVELVEDLKKEGEKEVTNYKNVDSKGNETFTDLCRGGHVKDLKDIPADCFKVMSLAGAYWRGDEKNKQLTRIYVAAFASKAELDEYLKMMEEAKKRDHRKLGKELDLFTFSEMVGPGLPLWMPKGTVIADELEKLAQEMEAKAGYLHVRTPHVAKGKLYEKTGHLAHYKECMFPPMQLEDEEYYIKPMNCPHHHEIYASRKRSYRDLPMRLTEYGHCYRYEDSGALFGLMRVRSLSMNDAHIYCTEEQFEEEFIAVANMYLEYFKILGIDKYVMRFSLHGKEGLGTKYVDNAELWKRTEGMVRDAMKKTGCACEEVEDEAAFYGPKVDVEVWSAIGREFTLATNQVDFDIPGKMGLTYISADGSEKTPLCIHRAPLGTHERTIGFLIEHFAGHFPLWLAPVQMALLPVSQAHEEYARKVEAKLKDQNMRVEFMDSSESLGKRIRAGEKQRIPYLLVIGDKEVSDQALAVRNVRTKNQAVIKVSEFMEKVLEDIKTRSLTDSVG